MTTQATPLIAWSYGFNSDQLNWIKYKFAIYYIDKHAVYRMLN